MVRVTEQQYQRMQNKKEAAGYATLSQFIRDRCLKDDLWIEQKINEIHQAVVKKTFKSR